MCKFVCTGCDAHVETAHRNVERIMDEQHWRPIFPEKGLLWLCPNCAKKAEELAVELMSLLKGHAVPVWHLISERRRLKLHGDQPDAAEA